MLWNAHKLMKNSRMKSGLCASVSTLPSRSCCFALTRIETASSLCQIVCQCWNMQVWLCIMDCLLSHGLKLKEDRQHMFKKVRRVWESQHPLKGDGQLCMVLLVLWKCCLLFLFSQYMRIIITIINNNNNNNDSYIALYPVKIYKLVALYIINIKIRLTIKKSASTINAYINIKMTKKPGWNKKNIKAFYTHRNNHKYYKIMHILIPTWHSEKHKYCHDNHKSTK